MHLPLPPFRRPDAGPRASRLSLIFVTLFLLSCTDGDPDPSPASPPAPVPSPPNAPANPSPACGKAGLGTGGSMLEIGLETTLSPSRESRALAFLGPERLALAEGGRLRLLDLPGGAEKKAVSLGKAVHALALLESGNLAALSDSGVFVLSREGAVLKSFKPFGGGTVGEGARLRAGDGGSIGVSSGARAEVYAEDGRRIASYQGPNAISDIAVSDRLGLLFICGFTQVTAVLQIPWMHALSFSGATEWTNYNRRVDGLISDTRCDRLALSGDRLYMAGEQAGGASPFNRDPKDAQKQVSLAGGDAYQRPYNLNGAAHITFVAAYEAISGNLLTGSHFVARLPNTKGNTLKPADLAVGPDGTLFVTGVSAYALPGEGSIKVGGETMAPRGAYLLALDPAFCRLLWVTFGGAMPRSLAVTAKKAAVLGGSAAFAPSGGRKLDTAGAYVGVFPLP